MDKKLLELVEKYNVVVIMKFGSHLYGTNTPNSDTDYKGVFIPTADEILLQNIPKSINITPKKSEQGIKNTADDIDIELYSLQYFIELCLKGETVSVDMLHCPDEFLVYKNGHLWEFLRSSRSDFYSKDIKALVGYCKKQAAKYGIKGSRISDAENVINFLDAGDPDQKLCEVWDKLPTGENIKFVDEFYEVCGKKFQGTIKNGYASSALKIFVSKYGSRAKLAKKNEGVDWKAISHAVRFALQIKDMFTKGDITFPLEKAQFLKEIKKGEIDFTWVSQYLDKLLDEIDVLVEQSNLPQKSPRGEWDFFIKRYHKYIVESC